MILLVTASSRGKECAAALEHGTGQKTYLASSVPHAMERMRNLDFDVLAIDQSLLETDFRALDVLLNHAGTAMPLYLNLGLHSTDRVVREVRVGLQRTDKEKLQAMRAAERVLRNDLRGEVTGILLTAQLALRRTSGVPAEITEKLELVHQMAEKMRARLHVV